MGGYAWVTLATNDAYSLGALVLAHSLRRVGTQYELAVLVTPGVTETMREKLSAVFSVVMEVNVLDSKDEANLALLARPELGITFTKLHCWRLTQYDKCVFLDADTLVIRNCDELFEREELSAAPDVGWPDCFNSGVFVYIPSQQTFASITAFAAAKGSFDGGDQGLLNMYFSDWAHKDISKHLPFIYNMCSTATYSYLPAFKQFGDDVRIIHFIGITKPWLQYFDTLTGIVQPPMGSQHLQPLLQLWWNIFCEKVHPQLSPVMATSTLAPIWHEFTPMPHKYPTPESPMYTDIQDKKQNDIFIETPDFSEFKDPWENYCVKNDPVIYKKEDNKRTEQYYSTIDNSSPVTVLSDNYNNAQSVHQTHYESPREHNREFYHKQCNEHVPSFSHNQHHHNHQEQSNQFSENKHTSFPHVQQYHHQDQSNQFSENKQQHSCFHFEGTKQSDYCENQHSKENYAHVHCEQSHHSTESQHQEHHQHVDHQHVHQYSYNDNNKSLSQETREHQHHEPYVEHQHHEAHVKHQHCEAYNDHHHHEAHVEHQHHEAYNDHQHHEAHVKHQHHEAYNDHQHHEAHVKHQHHEAYNDHQHHEAHVEHQHNHQHHQHQHNQQQVYHNVNNQQTNQYYQEENHIAHSTEQTDFQYHKQESPHVKVDHEQFTGNNVIHQNNFSKQSTEQNKNITITDERTNIQISTSPHPVSKPCTDFHKVATQSDPHVTERLDSPNAGLAGALAQMTLGEPRSAAQIALEEHMRKQSWEQGQIDYMGRDSFDNIWKKICQTLALAPPRLPSPPKEIPKSAKSETDKTAESPEPAEPVQPADSKDEVDTKTAQATTSLTEEQSLGNDVPITKSENVESKLSEKDKQENEKEQTVSNETTKDVPEKLLMKSENESHAVTVDSSSTQLETQILPEKVSEEVSTSSLLKEVPQEATSITVSCELVQSQSAKEQEDKLLCKKDSPIASTETLADSAKNVTSLEITVDTQQTLQSDIGDEKHAKELSTASEVLTVSPVPIQVAESVLQIEPKESMLDTQTITQEVLSSTITPSHESNVPSSEISTKPEEKVQMNGSATVSESVQEKEKLCSSTVATVESIHTASKQGESSAQTTETEKQEKTSQPAEQSEPLVIKTPVTLPSSITESKETTSADESVSQATKSVEPAKEIGSTTETVEPIKSLSECEVDKTSACTESPLRPSRAKEASTSSTSVTKTPSEDSKGQEKVTKKTVKKSTEKSVEKPTEKPALEGEPTETADGEGTGKKVVKKVVKKVTKKPKSKQDEALDDGAADSSSPSKVKKTVKVVKKSTKPLQTPETDAAAPETPSSSTSNAPVPPKRKTKATTKPVVKKSNVE